MAFKNEDRKSHIINTNDIFRKASDENFEKLINEIREANLEGRTNAGRNSFAQLIQQFRYLWDENESAWVQPLVYFVNIATQIGCYGCETVTQTRKDEVANYFQDLEAFKNLVKQREDFFDYKELCRDENAENLILTESKNTLYAIWKSNDGIRYINTDMSEKTPHNILIPAGKFILYTVFTHGKRLLAYGNSSDSELKIYLNSSFFSAKNQEHSDSLKEKLESIKNEIELLRNQLASFSNQLK